MPRIGLIYDLLGDYPWREGDPPDADAEYEPEETVRVLEQAVRSLGHEPVRIGTAWRLVDRLRKLDFAAAINIAECTGGRNREGYVPAILEMAGVPFLGSDALTLSLSLDKAWTKDLAVAAGVRTPPYVVFRPGQLPDSGFSELCFPLFVKPRFEGTAKGIRPTSRTSHAGSLREEVRRIHESYRQDALVERFIEGSEFTVAVIGNDPPEALPVMQRAVEKTTGIGLHALERKGVKQQNWTFDLPGRLDRGLEDELQRFAVTAYEKLECKDFARVDFRVDGSGTPWFIEINPLPTFAPDGTFAIIAEISGKAYPNFLADLLARGFARIGVHHPGRSTRTETE